MEKIKSMKDLRESIKALELKRNNGQLHLKEEFYATCERLKPVNLLKRFVTNWTDDPHFRSGLLDVGLTAAAGYVSRRAFVGGSRSPVRRFLGVLLQESVSALVVKYSDDIQSGLTHVTRRLNSLRKKDFTQAMDDISEAKEAESVS